MNYNELYSRRNKQRPKRSGEEKKNLRRILLGACAGTVAGLLIGLAVILIYNIFN